VELLRGHYGNVAIYDIIYRVIHKSLQNFRTRLCNNQDRHSRKDILSTGRIETCSVSPSVDMLPFGVTVPAAVPQRADIPEGLMNYPVYI
jgi:hypothetical protein